MNLSTLEDLDTWTNLFLDAIASLVLGMSVSKYETFLNWIGHIETLGHIGTLGYIGTLYT